MLIYLFLFKKKKTNKHSPRQFHFSQTLFFNEYDATSQITEKPKTPFSRCLNIHPIFEIRKSELFSFLRFFLTPPPDRAVLTPPPQCAKIQQFAIHGKHTPPEQRVEKREKNPDFAQVQKTEIEKFTEKPNTKIVHLWNPAGRCGFENNGVPAVAVLKIQKTCFC